jgi:peptidoglycan/LPS O-acetylase OafA/YrhL
MPGKHSLEASRSTPHRGEHRGDIQGLRAVAVLAVVLYHAGVPAVRGGYAGVDCFFVISGFLITGLLIDVESGQRRLALVTFYARRARRILPAALLVLITTALVSVAVLPPLQARQVLRDCLSSALFAGNYRFAAVGTNYLAGNAAPSPVQHFWSLGVEEQFYLVWPLLIAAVVLVARRVAVTAVVLAAATIFSFWLGLGWTRDDPPWAFFSMPSRAWELGVGVLLCLALPRLHRMPRWLPATFGWVGLATLVWSFTALQPSTPFPGTAALLPVLATAAVLAARGSGAGLALDRRPCRYVGDLSYSWYLWHWPVLVLMPAILGHAAAADTRLSLAAGSAVLAAATLHGLENPVRFAASMRAPRRALTAGAAMVLAGTVTSVAGAVIVGDPTGRGPAVAPLTLPAAAGTGASAGRGAAAHAARSATPPWRFVDERLAALLAHATNIRAVPRNLSPSLADAAGDKAQPFLDGCNLTWTDTEQPPCTYTNGQARIVVLGDSHAAQWFPPLQAIATDEHLRLESLTKTTCPPVEVPVFSPYLGRPYTECETWRAAVLARIKAERPALVVLGVARHYSNDYHFSVYSKAWDTGLAAVVRTLRAARIHTLVLGPTPKPPADVPTCLSAHLGDAAACTFSRTSAVDAAGAAAERATVLGAGGSYLDVAPWICTTSTCAAIVGNMLVYRDDNHLTTTYTRWLRPALQPAIDAARHGQQVR